MSETNDKRRSEPRSLLAGLAKELGHLPSDKRRAALEVSAGLAGVSLRVSREFVAAIPGAAAILSADDLRNWGEIGRRLAMGSVDLAVKFFRDGIEAFRAISPAARPYIFEICKRQLVLSSSIALETFHLAPLIVSQIDDERFATEIFRLGAEIAARSAKHSADLLQRTALVADALAKFGNEKHLVAEAVISLAFQFAHRTGGMTADLWTVLPAALGRIKAAEAIRLLATAERKPACVMVTL